MLQTLTNATSAATSASQTALEAWRRIIAALGANLRPHSEQTSPELLYLRAAQRARSDAVDASEQRFAKLLSAHPTCFPAAEEHARLLDRMGRRNDALAQYDSARRGRQRIRRGLPDRPFFTRHRTTSVAEIDGYTHVSRVGVAKNGVFALVARGHAYLATQRPRLALLDYDEALRRAPTETGLLVAKGEALQALGNSRDALQVLDRAVAARPRDPEAFSSRAIVQLALGRLAEADADWRRQLELLPRERPDARACVLLRLADYEAASRELERALERNPREPYLQLYFLTALRRLGRSAPPGVAATDASVEAWPGPLLALYGNPIRADEALQRADNPERRGEALFQLAVQAGDHDRDEAGRLWRQAAKIAAPDTIEHAAALHEIDRLRSVPQPVSRRRATERETVLMAMSK